MSDSAPTTARRLPAWPTSSERQHSPTQIAPRKTVVRKLTKACPPGTSPLCARRTTPNVPPRRSSERRCVCYDSSSTTFSYSSGERRSASSEARSLTIQPSPYGSSLIFSGASSRDELTSTTSPPTGEYRSETALTLSTVPKESPATMVAPLSGSSTNTTSPSSSWAWSVMPMVTVSFSLRTHSWLLVYCGSPGTLKVLLPLSSVALVEW